MRYFPLIEFSGPPTLLDPIANHGLTLGVVSFWYDLKTTNPGKQVSRKTEPMSIRVNVTLD